MLALCFAVLVNGEGRSQTPALQSPQWNAFVDEFLAETHHTASLTPQHFVDELAHTKAQLAQLRALDPARLSPDEALDRRFAESILIGRELEQQRMRRWRMDPRVYMRSIQIVLAALDHDPSEGDRAARVAVVLDALRAIPIELRNGQDNLTLYVPRFRDQSVSLVNAAATVLATGIPAIADSLPTQRAVLLAANTAAREALAEWTDFLTTYLPKWPSGYYAIGIETYDAMLKEQYLAPFDSDDLYQYARREFDRTIEELETVAKDIDPAKKWQAIATESNAAGPDARKAIQIYQDAIAAVRARMAGARAIPIPWKERLDVVPREKRVLNTAYYASSSGSAERQADGTLVGRWQINQDDAATQNFFGEHDGTVATVTAYAAYAEHVLALYQMHNSSTLRRAMGSSMFAEGWGLYYEQLAREGGAFPDARVHLRQLQLKLWRIARVVVDVGLHTGKMTESQAATLMTDRLGLVKTAADLEIAASADTPGAHLGYAGLIELLRIRDELQSQRGAQFSLSDFHERLMKTGPLPPALVRAALIL